MLFRLGLLDEVLLVDEEAFVGDQVELLRPRQIRKSIKELVVILASSCRLQHRLQVLFAKLARDRIVKRSDFDVDELLASLDGLSELVVEAPGHEDDLDQNDVEHVRPPD